MVLVSKRLDRSQVYFKVEEQTDALMIYPYRLRL